MLVALALVPTFPSTQLAFANNNATTASQAANATERANLVLFAYFSDQDAAWWNEASRYDTSKTNAQLVRHYYEGEYGRSFANYMSAISGGQYQVKNVFPQWEGEQFSGTVNAYKLPFTSEEAKTTNIDYSVMKELLEQVDLTGLAGQLDYGEDGSIDNVTIVFAGGTESMAGTNGLPTLYPHQSVFAGSQQWQGTGLYVGAYNMLNTASMTDGNIPSRSGVIAHEYLHSLNFPDLYTGDGNNEPVGAWDIMSVRQPYGVLPLAYLRANISHWATLDEISYDPTKTGPQARDVTLSVFSETNRNNAVVINSPVNPYEKFVVEVRQKGNQYSEDDLDAGIPGSGVIVYRVDTAVSNLSNYRGSKLGVYVFRKAGIDPKPLASNAILNATNSSFGESDLNKSENAITYSDGSNTGIVISDVSDIQDGQVSFKVTLPDWSSMDTWNSAEYPNPQSSTSLAMATIDGSQIVATSNGSSINFKRYGDEAWTDSYGPITDKNNVTEPLCLASYDDVPVVAYASGNGNLIVRAYQNNAWTLVGSVTSGSINSISMTQAETGLAVAFSDDSGASLATIALEDGTLKLSNPQKYYQGLSGNAFAVSTDKGVYVSVRKANEDNEIGLWRWSGQSFEELNSSEKASSYDLVAYNNDLYLAPSNSSKEPSEQKLAVLKYDQLNKSWKEFATGAIDSISPKLAVALGNLYVVTRPATEESTRGIEAYEVTSKGFVQEGLAVARDQALNAHCSLVASGDTLLVSYLNKDNKPVVKKKTMANKLLSLSIVPPKKTTYLVGGTVDPKGIEVTANYRNGSRALAEGEYEITGFDAGTAGEHNATVAFKGSELSNTFPYIVYAKDVQPAIEDKAFKVEGGMDGTDYTYDNGVLKVLTNKPLAISLDSGIATSHRIEIANTCNASVTLKGVRIGTTQASGDQAKSPISLGQGSTLDLTLAESSSNVLKAATGNAGIYVPEGATLTVNGPGALDVAGGDGAAGIGGSAGDHVVVGKIKIEGGAITAKAGSNAQAIGYGNGGGFLVADQLTIIGGALKLLDSNGTPFKYTENDVPLVTGGVFENGTLAPASLNEADRGLVNGAMPHNGYAVVANLDNATKDAYPYAVYRADFATLEVAPPVALSYNGSSVAGEALVATAKYGENDPEEGDVSFSCKAKDDANSPWIEGLPSDAGSWQVRVHLKAKVVGDTYYRLVQEETSVIVSPREVALIWSGNAGRAYGDGKGLPSATIGNRVGDDDVSVVVQDASPNVVVGAKTVKAAGLSGTKAANYVLKANADCAYAVSKGTATAKPASLEVKNNLERAYEYDLAQLLPKIADNLTFGNVTYSLKEVKLKDGYYDSGASISDSRLLLPVKAVDSNAESEVGTVKIVVSSDHYDDFEAAITVKAINKDVPQGTPTLSTEELVYGQPLSDIGLSGAMKDAQDAVVEGSFAWKDPSEILPAGDRQPTWVFTPVNADEYAEVTGTASVHVKQYEPTFDIPAQITAEPGSAFGDLRLSNSAQGVAGTPIDGAVTWFLDEQHASPLPNDYAFPAEAGKKVTLYWAFEPASPDYQSLSGSALFTVSGSAQPGSGETDGKDSDGGDSEYGGSEPKPETNPNGDVNEEDGGKNTKDQPGDLPETGDANPAWEIALAGALLSSAALVAALVVRANLRRNGRIVR